MSKQSVVLGALLAACTTGLQAQYAAAPAAYSATSTNAMMGTASTTLVARDGSKAMVDVSYAAQGPAPGSHLRTLYDLDAHTNYTWDLNNASTTCTQGSFQGDWGDPFAASEEIRGELAKVNAKPAGADTINGFSTKVMAAEDTVNKIRSKAWIEPKYGMIVKLEMTGADGKTVPMMELKELSVAKPTASAFARPAACAALPPPVHVPTEKERYTAETGDNGDNFVNAGMGPGSQNSCTMLMRVVRAGSMQPVTGYQVALDLNFDMDHPPSHSIGVGSAGHSTFSGGNLKEVTGQIQNGVLRIDNIPDHFDVEMTFGNGGAASAMVYRKCAGPQTVLFYVVKNPDKLQDGGDWMWVKSGKFAAVAGN